MSDLTGLRVVVSDVPATGRFARATGRVEAVEADKNTFGVGVPAFIVRFDGPVFGWVDTASFRAEELEVSR